MTYSEIAEALEAEGLKLLRSNSYGSGFKWVYNSASPRSPFLAKATVDRVTTSLGVYATAEEAALAVARFVANGMPRGEKRAAEADEPETERTAKFRKAVDDGADEFLCPITQALPVDPVMAEDGRVYERSAISKWLSEKKTSPHTNAAMGTKLIPALQVKNMIDRMVRTGAWTGDKCEAWRLKIKQEEEVEATRKKAEAGDVEAMLQLVDWYTCGGKGLAADEALRFAWARRAADLDNPSGLYEVSKCYEYGVGTKRNEELKWAKLTQAATLGYGEAIYDLVLLYKHKGEHSEALYWAKRGVYWAKRVGDDYFWNTAGFIPSLEKKIAEERS